jgi:hypothetical protein
MIRFGQISENGSVIEECKDWRKKIRDHYMNWKDNMEYPVIFLIL